MNNHKLYNFLILSITVSPLLFLISCAKTEPTFSDLWDNKFKNCGVSCHSPGASDGTENGPDLSTKSGFYNNLINKTVDANYPNWAAVKTSNCNDVNFIKPGDANLSTLAASLIKSKHDALKASNSCDSAYNIHAVTFDTISNPDLANDLIAWINDGAAND